MAKLTKAQVGHLGGTACRNAHGSAFYAKIGRRGTRKRSRLLARGKEREVRDEQER